MFSTLLYKHHEVATHCYYTNRTLGIVIVSVLFEKIEHLERTCVHIHGSLSKQFIDST